MIGKSGIPNNSQRPASHSDQRTAQAILDNCAALAGCPGWNDMLLPQIVGQISSLSARILDDRNAGHEELRDLRNQRWALKGLLDSLQAAQQQARGLLDKTPTVSSQTEAPHSDAPIPAFFAEALGVKPTIPTPADILKEAAKEFNPFASKPGETNPAPTSTP